ncbi:MAG: hypothetical protein GY710_03000 [Desulfobacteraceae bacterium]|nr:hypothetical protein [Desulfobacteraceae bacterium]
MKRSTSSKSITHIKVSDAIPLMHGSPNQMFHSSTVELVIPENSRQIVMTQDKEGRVPCRILDFARITVEYPSGRTQETEINHNDHNDFPLGEQHILSNMLPFETGKHVIRVELWSRFAPMGPNFASTPIYLCVIPEETNIYRVKITDAIPSGKMSHKGSFLNRTVQLMVAPNYSRVVLSTDPTGSKQMGIYDVIKINFSILLLFPKQSKAKPDCISIPKIMNEKLF